MNATDAAIAELLELELARAECREGDGGAVIFFRPSFSVECVVSLRWRARAALSVRTPTRSAWQFVRSQEGAPSYPPHAGFIRPALSKEVLEDLECSAARKAFAVALQEETAPQVGIVLDGMSVELELFQHEGTRQFDLHSVTYSASHPLWRFIDAALELTKRCTWWTSRAALEELERYLR